MRELLQIDAGIVPYAAACRWQRDLHARRVAGQVPDTLVLLEHPHVFTLGRNFRREHLLAGPDELRDRGIEVHESDRGGSITYHGPGQLVAYPVLDLRPGPGRHPDVIGYLRALESAVIGAVAEFGIEAKARRGLTGVWVAGEKIAAVGVNVSRGVSKHGLALNVSTDLRYFEAMVPCGIEGGRVTSMEQVLGNEVPLPEVKAALAARLAGVFRRLLRAGEAAAGGLDFQSPAGKDSRLEERLAVGS